jgi:4-amino-4-deoxy-L-arabinose transferase-like glycosyltransferase
MRHPALGRFAVQFHSIPRGIWILTIAVAVLRLGIAIVLGLDPQRLLEPDSTGYLDPARSLIHDLAFVDVPGSETPEFIRTPGYPVVLAAALLLTQGSVRSVAALQAMLSALVLIPAFALARRLFDTRVAWAAAILLAVDPLTTWYSTQILTETLTAALITVMALLLVRAIQDDRRQLQVWLMIGLVAAIATHVRPSQYYFIAVATAATVTMALRRGWTRRQTAVAVFALLTPSVALVGGWQVRNSVQVGSLRFSGIEAVNMYLYRAAGVIALRDGRDWIEVQSELEAAFPPRAPDEDQGPYFDRMFRAGAETVVSHPSASAIVTARGVWRSAVSFPVRMDALFERWQMPDVPIVRWLVAYAMIPVWGLIAVGANVARRRTRSGSIALGVVITYVLLVSAGPEAYSRFRVPIMPILLVFAAGGVLHLGAWWGAFRQRRRTSRR